MNSLYDSKTGAEFRLGDDGRYYCGGVAYDVKEGDTSPLGTGGTLTATAPNVATLPIQGASGASLQTGDSGQPATEHRRLIAAMVEAVKRGRSAAGLIENVVKMTSPLQLVQQASMDAFLDLYSALPTDQQGVLDQHLELYQQDPLYTVDKLLSEASSNPAVADTVRQQILNIAARFNLILNH